MSRTTSSIQEAWVTRRRGRHLIVGASAAGTAAAHTLRTQGFEGDICLVDSDPVLPYERPPLSKQSGAGTVPIFPREFYGEHGVDLRLGVEVRQLDRASRRVLLSDGEWLDADAVLLATGVAARRLTVPGSDLRNVLSLRTAADAHALHDRLEQGPLVAVGGGFIGLEAAAVARSRGVDVTVLERTPLPLERSVGAHLATRLVAAHHEHGVRFATGVTVDAFLGADAVEAVRLSDGRVLPAATVLVGVGTEPRSRLAMQVGLHCQDGVVVDGSYRTRDPWVLAAGDGACVPDLWGRYARIEHWDTAVQQGTAAGSVMAGRDAPPPSVPYFWSEQYDLVLQVHGRPQPGDEVVYRPTSGPSDIVFWLRDGRLAAAGGIGAARELRAVRPLLQAAAPVDAAALADPAVRLRDISADRRIGAVA